MSARIESVQIDGREFHPATKELVQISQQLEHRIAMTVETLLENVVGSRECIEVVYERPSKPVVRLVRITQIGVEIARITVTADDLSIDIDVTCSRQAFEVDENRLRDCLHGIA